MFCIKCGAQLEEGAKFCIRCGAQVQEDVTASLSQTNPEITQPMMQTDPGMTQPMYPQGFVPGGMPGYAPVAENQSLKKKKKISKVAIISGILAALLVAGGVAFFALGGVDRIKVSQKVKKGNQYLNEMEYEQAIAMFEEAIEINPNAVSAYKGLADAYVGLEEFEKAIEVLEEGIERTNSDELREHLEGVWDKWNDLTRCIVGAIYKADYDLDDTNNEALYGAHVLITDAHTGEYILETYLSDYGTFETGILPKGDYEVYCTADGFYDCDFVVDLSGGRYDMSIFMDYAESLNLSGNLVIADMDTDYSNNEALSEAQIELEKLTGTNEYSEIGVSLENGDYYFYGLCPGVYQLKVHKDGFLDTEQIVTLYQGSGDMYSPLIEMLPEEYGGRGVASGTIIDALTGYGVEGLSLEIRFGANNLDGEIVGTTMTQAGGYYVTPEMDAGIYCITIKDERGTGEDYLQSSINVKILGNTDISNQDGTVSTSLVGGQMRVVLTWGATPDDLDSHMYVELYNGDSGNVYWSNTSFYSESERVVDLDLDDVNCYGPETITVYDAKPGIYYYYVRNYTADYDYQLSESGAVVQVYLGTSGVPAYTFYVPSGYGYDWVVFSFDSTTGVLTPVNTIEY